MAKKSYTIEFTEDRDKMMSLILTMFGDDKIIGSFLGLLEREGVKDTFMAFIKESADKQHALGWCHDPNCPDKS